MERLRTQQLSSRIRRVWLEPAAGFERLPDPCLATWTHERLANTSVSTPADLTEAGTVRRADGAACAEPIAFEQTAEGRVRIAFSLRPGERVYGAFDSDATPGLDRRGDHVHYVTELHPHGRHLMIEPCAHCGGGPDPAAEAHDDVAGGAADQDAEAADAQQAPGENGLTIGDGSSNYGELHLPFFFTSSGYAVYISNAHTRGMLDIGQIEPDRWTFTAPAGEADIYLLGPGTPAELVQLFARLTGHQPLPPAWALGFLQSRFGYESFEHARSVLERFGTEQLPVHALVFDVQWLREHVDLQWNPDGFQNARENIAAMAQHGVRLLVITEPGTRRDASNFGPGMQAGAFARDETGEIYDADQWYTRRGIEGYRRIEPSQGALVNFFNQGAADWWYSLHRHLLEDGVDAWWFDLNEPEDVGEGVVFPNVDWPAAREELSGAEARNLFALAQQRAFAQRDQAETDRRPFVITRSGAAGSQRYGAAPWSGDVAATWEDLRRQPRIGLMAGLCGIPMWGCDVGGFNGNPGSELFARWVQLGSFVPVFRAHGYMADREPWSQGPEALAAARAALVLRAQLLPSIVTWVRESFAVGLPLMRPLLLDHPDDERWHDCDDQWLFGPLLVAPVMEQGATSRSVELPEGAWIDLWTGTTHVGGGALEVPVEPHTLPVFVPRAQALVADPDPLAGRGRAWPPRELEVWSFAGADLDAETTLYVDDGATRQHEEGAYCHQRIRVHHGALEVERLAGGFPAPGLRLAAPHPGRVDSAARPTP